MSLMHLFGVQRLTFVYLSDLIHQTSYSAGHVKNAITGTLEKKRPAFEYYIQIKLIYTIRYIGVIQFKLIEQINDHKTYI